MLKAAIFDLNGIFLQSPKLSVRFEQDFGIPADVFLGKLGGIMDKVRAPGAGPAFTYWEPVLKEWGLAQTEGEFWKYWFEAEKPSERMIAFARSLRERSVKVFVLSNNFKERSEYYGQYPWVHEAVDTVYFSWKTGFIKPDARAWSSILEEHGLAPEECVYFDDQDKNVKAATELGILAFKFTTEEELEREVERLLPKP